MTLPCSHSRCRPCCGLRVPGMSTRIAAPRVFSTAMRLIFMGTPGIAVPALDALVAAGHEVAAVFTQPDRPVGRKQTLEAPEVKVAATRHAIPVHQPSKVRNEETRALVASFEPDAAVVFAYGRILPQSLLDVPRRGCINVHTSLLPKYRGAAPIQWAIAEGETKTGVTTMLMDAGLDTGPMLLCRETPIAPTETAVELSARLATIGAGLIVETLARLDEIDPEPQNDGDATLAPILTREHGLIDWRMRAATIANRCRGFQPWPGTWTTLDGARLHVWSCDATPSDAATTAAPPGTVVEAGRDRLVVSAGEGSRLAIRELQLEGKRRMPVREFQNGVRIEFGHRLGGDLSS